jgi:hypothetical protein
MISSGNKIAVNSVIAIVAGFKAFIYISITKITYFCFER